MSFFIDLFLYIFEEISFFCALVSAGSVKIQHSNCFGKEARCHYPWEDQTDGNVWKCHGHTFGLFGHDLPFRVVD